MRKTVNYGIRKKWEFTKQALCGPDFLIHVHFKDNAPSGVWETQSPCRGACQSSTPGTNLWD